MVQGGDGVTDVSCAAVDGVCDNGCGGRRDDLLPVVNGSFVVALNEVTAEIYRRNGMRCDAVVQLGIDVERFRPDPAMRTSEVSIYTSSAWAGYPTKGMHILSRAVKGTPYGVNLLTGLPRDRVAEELRKAHIYVYPSCYPETWGLCLTEAMASGCACITTDVAGASVQVVHGETGLIVPRRDPVALRDAIDWLMGDEELRQRLGEAAREWAVAHASLEAMGRRWEETYRAAMGVNDGGV